MKASYSLLSISDTHIIIADNDESISITNNAESVVKELASNQGIRHKKIYYRDTDGRFDELVTHDDVFVGFKPCSPGQQDSLSRLN